MVRSRKTSEEMTRQITMGKKYYLQYLGLTCFLPMSLRDTTVDEGGNSLVLCRQELCQTLTLSW
jgi:hypothetical protein